MTDRVTVKVDARTFASLVAHIHAVWPKAPTLADTTSDAKTLQWLYVALEARTV